MNQFPKGRIRLWGKLALFALGALVLSAGMGLVRSSAQTEPSSRLWGFRLSRYVNCEKLWSRSLQVREGWTTIDEKQYRVYIGAGDLKWHVRPDLPKGRRYYSANFPGYGEIIASEVDPGETWVFSADGKTVADGIGRFLDRKFRFDYKCTAQGKTIHSGDAEGTGPVWVQIRFKGQLRIIFRALDALPEERPKIEVPHGATWAHLYLSGVGEFYARVDNPNEVWTFSSPDYGTTVSGKGGSEQS